MPTAVILFEDHAAERFRPLSWTVPVYELGCGLFNLRERLTMVTEDAAAEGAGVAGKVLLPRGLLLDVQKAALPDGWSAGPDAAASVAAAADRVLFMNARSAGRMPHLKECLAAVGDDGVWRDDEGPTAWSCDAATASATIESWRAWDRETNDAGHWGAPKPDITPWRPEPAGDSAAAPGWTHLWQRVPEIGAAVADDIRDVVAPGRSWRRWLFGVQPLESAAPAWTGAASCQPFDSKKTAHVHVVGGRGVWCAPEVTLDPGVVLDVREGPMVLERGVHVQPNTVLQGPLALGAGTTVKAGAVVYGETVAGPVCKLSGEIAESQIAAYANKQHAGFLGHAVIGSWTNLGADTTCSDLKNNYGEIKVNWGAGPVDTGTRFLGLMMAEHAKSAIGTTFNTATTVGVSANVFASGFPRTLIPNFAWGDGRGRRFQVERALETARIVFARRQAAFTDAHENLFRNLWAGTGEPRDEQPAR